MKSPIFPSAAIRQPMRATGRVDSLSVRAETMIMARANAPTSTNPKIPAWAALRRVPSINAPIWKGMALVPI
jgi:hypothetical protein